MKKILLIVLFTTGVCFGQTYEGMEFYDNGNPKLIKTYKESKGKLELVKQVSWYWYGQKKEEGAYKEGKKEGLWTYWYENGKKKEEINWKDEQYNGKNIQWYVNGQKLQEGAYKEGKKEGLWTYWYENGKKKEEINWKDEQYNGKNIQWYENGQKKLEGTQKDWRWEGLFTTWYENGQKQQEGTYKDGELDGLQREWYENGQKQQEGTYKDGELDGLQREWYENGEKSYEGNFKNGKKDGLTIIWHENGQKKQEGTFKDGEFVSSKYWNEDGTIIENVENTNVCISTIFGDIIIELFPNIAPKHIESFLIHVNNGYYNKTIFHRVIPGFMIQGGDPNTKGENKASYGSGGHAAKYYGIGKENDPGSWTLPAEFSDIKHTRGIVSMARSTSPSSGGSQFFICAANASHLDGQYTAFGKVLSGLEVVDQITNSSRDARDNPNQRIEMNIDLCNND